MDLPLSPLASRRRHADRAGDAALRGLAAAAGLGSVALVGLVVWKVVDGARLSIAHFGPAFVWRQVWDPNRDVYGALDLIYGTAVTSAVALLLAAPISIAIGLYLSELAPRGVRGAVGSLVEMLVAVPSVVLGLWGILVLGPFVQQDLEPALGAVLGWTPFFRGPHHTGGLLPATIVLTIMIVPISASVCRELFTAVPADLKEGAIGLGLTRWEMVRGVVLPYTRGGVAAAILLGLGRALGEAIAVTQVIGSAQGIHLSFFALGDTLASRIASQYQGALTHLAVSSLVYLALILLVLTLAVNLSAQVIVKRFEARHGH
ncbi:MAG TPA: phosphate ABC transporter permease subunit PstC [Gaiellaceae bacterium]|nr:phosphate ABC transporter permease subunit PstC [Gaiellaceae bacterium]